MHAQTKSGTTWLESILKEIASQYCFANGCTVENMDWSSAKPFYVRFQNGQKMKFDLHFKHNLLLPHSKTSTHPGTNASGIRERWEARSSEVPEVAKHNQLEKKCRIGVYRDPRDVTISACHFFTRDCNPDQYLTDHLEATATWIGIRHEEFSIAHEFAPNTHFMLFYPDLMNEFVPTVTRLARDLGLPVDKAVVAEMEQKFSVKNMKKRESKGLVRNSVKHYGSKVRKGGLCEFRTEVSSTTAREATVKMASILPKDLMMRFECDEELRV
jgi:hypothetical protein